MSRIQKWGNSLGVRLPKTFVEQIGLGEGSEIELILRDGAIVISAARPHYDLRDLLEGCSPDNRPEPVDWGPSVGREIL